MNQEIEGDLEALFLKLQQDTLRATTRHCRLDLRKKAIKSIQELVCSTVPEKIDKIPPHCETDLILAEGFNDCRTEILKKWGKL